MAKKGKPFTHCEKYGHTWVPGTSEGFEMCSHISYDKKGKASPCSAARRISGNVPPSERATHPITQPSFPVPHVQQVSLFD